MTFPGFEPPAPPPWDGVGPAPAHPEKLSYGRRLTQARAAALERGQNPGSGLEVREPRDPRVTCGSCWHAVSRGGTRQTFWKCELGRLTNSEASDIRLSWPGCKAWTKTDDGKSNAPEWVTRASNR